MEDEKKNLREVVSEIFELRFLYFPDQFDRRERAKVHAQTAIAAALDVQIRRLARVRLHNGACLAVADCRAGRASLALIVVDADADGAWHGREYT